MADKNFKSEKGLTIANNVIFTSGSNVGFNNTSPAHTVSVTGTAYVSGNLSIITNLVMTGGIVANGSLGSATNVLASNGTSLYWTALPGGIAGSNTEIQFNDSAVANGSAAFVWTKTSNTLTVTGTTAVNGALTIAGTVTDAAANVVSQTLTDGATINWNTASGRIASVTLGGNRTMAAPTNLKVGTYILYVIQDGTGSRTVSWNSVFKWVSAIAPVLSTGAAARDVFSFVSDGTNLYGSYIPDVR